MRSIVADARSNRAIATNAPRDHPAYTRRTHIFVVTGRDL
jgi:hypothetical protein